MKTQAFITVLLLNMAWNFFGIEVQNAWGITKESASNSKFIVPFSDELPSSFVKAHEIIDDSDLTAGLPTLQPWQIPVDSELVPSEIQSKMPTGSKKIQITFIRRKGSALTPVKGLPILVNKKETVYTDDSGEISISSCQDGQMISIESKLQHSKFQIKSGGFTGGLYTLKAQIHCNADQTLFFDSEKPEGQALSIWLIGFKAQQKLQESVGLDFWKSIITFSWPSNGDYYNFNTVHLTRGDYWDIVGHELGHAIYDQANIGGMQGGQHKIDECYSGTLALSEGWASFFSGWLSVELDDPDAKFEFLVPRRAPIRFENIPSDVCAGENNEWRVSGFFWDLIDLHSDPETIETAFTKVWNALLGLNIATTSEALVPLVNIGISRDDLEILWQQNFLQPSGKHLKP